MPFEWQVAQLGSILRGRGVHQCLLVTTRCTTAAPARAAAVQSLTAAGIRFTQAELADEEWATAEAVDALVEESRDIAAQAVVGVGADGVLDAAKATSVLSRVQHESAAQFLAGVGREAAPPSSRLPMVAVLTRPSLAGCSGRCLLWSNAQLLPMQIQGDSSHWGVGPGVPATVEIVDADFALGARSTRTRLSEAQHNLVTAAAALALIADMWLSTSHTIKSAMLQESTVSAVTSIRSVLDTPEGCAIDALVATRVAGMAATDTDATA